MSLRSGKLPSLGSENEFFYHTTCEGAGADLPASLWLTIRGCVGDSSRGALGMRALGKTTAHP
jgi:hypothetical protein